MTYNDETKAGINKIQRLLGTTNEDIVKTNAENSTRYMI